MGEKISRFRRRSSGALRAASGNRYLARSRRPLSIPSGSTAVVERWRPWLIVAYALVILIATLQRGLPPYSYPVFPIFRASTGHLLAGQDLYAAYSQGDLFKYSPTFALLFAPFAALPFTISLLLWNALNAVMLWRAVTRLLPPAQAVFALALLTPELLVAAQASQSNALVASLIILAFIGIERDRNLWPALATALGAITKIFPLAALAFGAFAPSRRRFALAFACTLGGLLLLPLLVVSPGSLLAQYRSWGALESKDALARGMSVMGLLSYAARGSWPNWVVQAGGTAILLLPLAAFRGAWRDAEFRRTFLCSLLTYVVLFNPQAERPSYIIAAAGIAIWYVAGSRNTARTLILVLALSGLNLALPVCAAWVFMQLDLWRRGLRTASAGEQLRAVTPRQPPIRSFRG